VYWVVVLILESLYQDSHWYNQPSITIYHCLVDGYHYLLLLLTCCIGDISQVGDLNVVLDVMCAHLWTSNGICHSSIYNRLSIVIIIIRSHRLKTLRTHDYYNHRSSLINWYTLQNKSIDRYNHGISSSVLLIITASFRVQGSELVICSWSQHKH
jgi:hypothetical protein